MSSMEKLREVIIRKVFNRDAMPSPYSWAKAYQYLDTDITAEKIQAEIDAAREALAEAESNASVEIELLRSRVESEGD